MSEETTITPASWMYLPAELRLMILNRLINLLYRSRKGNAQELKRQWCAYHAVSREWQAFFERLSFACLTLHQSDLAEFGKIMQGNNNRQMSVTFVCLRIELPEYDCKKCKKRESPDEVRANQRLFTTAVWELFSILSQWKEHGEVGLEISVHSPSDALHYCQELKSRIHRKANMKQRYSKPRAEKKTTHGWRRGKRVHKPPVGAKLRVFGHPRGLGFDLRTSLARKLGTLPKVKVVTYLLIRRQFYRHFSVPKALGPMMKSLPRLEHLSYEPWRGIDTKKIAGRQIRDEQHTRLFLDVIQRHKSLRSVSMFESFNPDLHTKKKREAYPALGQSVAKTSRNLESLCATFNVDAKDFFYAFFPTQNPKPLPNMSWSNLTDLSLCSELLVPAHYNKLIQVAAAAALQMPKLRCMELWNSETHATSCIFRYFPMSGRRRYIQLLSTWGGRLGTQAIACWREVADRVAGCELRQESLYLDAHVFDNYASVMQYLFLRTGLLSPVSLYDTAVGL
ncbi:uncharacterized protein Triagg1_1432 [Trichoderma aggressivum f. europaeum]|uniref:DUF6546 domain-containing protein n=1 Tax=Trichoderma aggressivum f. europaeum TaxID=173218 RepID=A0AAE1M962_9HYPO|nr:hypothetical protein Triagg1_1432 [Trichoderma aggressivum f. europaeum]